MTRNLSSGALRGLRDRLAGLQTATFQMRLATKCGAAALKLVADEFRGSHDPRGNPWQPLKYRQGGKMRRGQYGPRRAGKPLMKTGRLRASFSTAVTPNGFRIGTAVQYAGYHQTGTATIPARPMLPDAGALPPAWQEAFAVELNRMVSDQISGRRA